MAAVPSRPATICPVTQHSCRGSVRSTAKYGAMESAGSSPNSRIRMSVVYELDSAMSACRRRNWWPAPMPLADTWHQIDGSGYGAYKRISGTHRLTNDIELSVDRVQSHPFAPPSLIQVRVPLESTGIVPETLAGVGS